jgi:hypothetical protein
LGDKCPWSVGWFEDGRKRSKKVGCRSLAEKFARKLEAQAEAGTLQSDSRVRWSRFRTEWEARIGGGMEPQTRRCTINALACKLATRPVEERENEAYDLYLDEQVLFESAERKYEVNFADWKRTKPRERPDEPPVKPEPPIMPRFLIGDTTIEALVPILLNNPRGVCLSKDELNGWFQSFNQYRSGGRGADASQWLEVFNAGQIIVEGTRKLAAIQLAPRSDSKWPRKASN